LKIKPVEVIHGLLRWLIFLSALIASTAVLMTFLTKIPSNPQMVAWAKFFSVFIECSAAFVLSLGLAYWKRGQPKSKDRRIAGALFVIYSTYVFVACLSAVFLFMTELNQKDMVAESSTKEQNIYKTRYDMAKADYDRWDSLMTKEEQNIEPGKKFRQYKANRDAAKAEMDKYETLLNSGDTAVEVVNNIQASFASIFPTAWRSLLITIFTIIMMFVYVMQVLTAWVVPLHAETAEVENATVKNNNATLSATPTSTTVESGLVLCGYSRCGESFPYRKGKEYCDDECRNAAFKERKRMEKLEQSLGYVKPSEGG
jgi:hypothetical protein